MDIALPIPRASFPAMAAGLFAILAAVSATLNRTEPDGQWNHVETIKAGILVLIPVICWIIWSPSPSAIKADGFQIKVMSYNIHSAYHVDGYQDLEGIARVIEESDADVIGLQEISRGRLMDGSADMPTWLSRRLNMPYLFQGTEEPTWGNAILSRYPILDSGKVELPKEDTLIGRGFLWAELDVGTDEPLLVIVTHLHHIVDDGYIREAQIPVILSFWNEREQTILIGDLNARPNSREIGLISESGMIDAWLEAGQGNGFTYASNNPDQRIDYIWISPDLKTVEIEVMQTQASDHLPVLGLFRLSD
jgi:endonuclease/exonuclease/phosphatase family metal-dependent hydrolase